jgi:predicted ATPase
MVIRTPDHRLRVFVSSTLKELAEERKVVRQAILKLRLAPVMFESGARPHPAHELYQSYLSQSQVFIAIYWQSYGWVAPGALVSGLEDEFNLSANMPRLIYIKNPAPNREPALTGLLNRIRDDNTSCYTYFSTPTELNELVQNDLALLLTEQFEAVQHPGQPAAATSLLPPINVPTPRNQLIDRQSELETALSLLLRDDIALLTLTGAGGTGKSRLALQIGLELQSQFKDGVYLVRLEPVSEPGLVIPTIADTLGIHEASGGRPISEMLKESLRGKHMLLLLDNFEQVVEAAPDISDLLEACQHLKAVVTSRTPLHLRFEKELPVPPLAVPSLEKSTELHSLSQYGAVELFIQRAQAVRPGFTVTNANAGAVAEICYQLDGLPLAIELAAARVNLLTPHELLARLERRFDLLRGGTRDLPERQRTLRGAIDWSYNLLSQPEKQLFRRLSVFVGGWTLDAMEQVCDLDGDLAQNLDDALASLIDNNLVIQAQAAGEDSRFSMLATIHEYASERLAESGEGESLRCRQANYFLSFVKIIDPRIRSAERTRWMPVFRQEFGNIRSVLEWSCRTGNCLDLGQQIVIMIGVLWITSGYILEAGLWCSQFMALYGEDHSSLSPASTITLAGLLSVAGWIAWAKGDLPAAEASLDESIRLLQGLNDKTPQIKQALGSAMITRGMFASSTRDLPTATAMYQKGIELARETRDLWYEAIGISWLGDIALYEGDDQRALDLHNQSIRLARQQGDPWCLMPALMSSGQIAVRAGDLASARRTFLEAEDLLRKTGDQWSLCWALNDLGHIALKDGALDQGSSYLMEALALSNTLWNRRALLVILAGVAAIVARRAMDLPETDPQRLSSLAVAGQLCGATVPFVYMPGVFVWSDTQMLYESDIHQVQSLLGDDLWEKAFAEGQYIPLEKAVALAIQSLNA